MRTIVVALALLVSVSVSAGDLPGSKDHPMVSRYEGSEIVKYDQRAFEAYPLIVGKIDKRGGRAVHPDSYRALEGKMTRVAYRVPEQRSVLEVQRNYESALKSAGFEILFACENELCGGRTGREFNEAATPKDMAVTMGFHEKDQRYLAARLARAEGDVYVSLYTVRAYSIGGANKDRVFSNLVVVEVQPMQDNMVKVDADAMAKGLDAEGHVALYEIYFDTNKAELKPESGAALAEIATLLKRQASLRILVVGHTDNAGELAYNQSLSERRARSVVEALVVDHGVVRDRLTAVGVGMAAPVASNDSETGRGKNRRVELVKR